MITELANFISFEDCDRLIKFNTDKNWYSITSFLTSNLKGANAGTEGRSYGVVLRKSDPFINKLLQRIALITGVPYENFEPPTIAKYLPNEEYSPHYDWIVRDKILSEGNRIKTFIIYLNNDFEGGQLYFPKIKKTITPQKGKAVFWSNAEFNKSDTLNKKLLHHSLKITKNNKYIFVVWAREKKFINYKWERDTEEGLRLPLIYEEHRNFLSKKLCNELIDWFTNSNKRKKEGRVVLRDAETFDFDSKNAERKVSDYRKAKSLYFAKNGDIAKKFNKKLCKILNVEVEYLENWIFVKYEEGGEYKEHPDYVDEERAFAENDKKIFGGLRLKTVLIYLNEDFEEGETWFPNIELKIKPETGKLVIWENVLSNLKPNKFSIHAGLPVKKGNKYAILTFVRQEKRP